MLRIRRRSIWPQGSDLELFIRLAIHRNHDHHRFRVAGNIAGLELVHPMAVVVLVGLVTATVLNLFVMPALYLRYGGSKPETDMSSL